MEPSTSTSRPYKVDLLRQHGFTESGSESQLREAVELASAFCAAPAVLALRDEHGIWFCKAEGLDAQALQLLEPLLTQKFVSEAQGPRWEGEGMCLVEGLWLLDDARLKALGCLCVVSPGPVALTPAMKAGLQRLAEQISALVVARQEQAERRSVPRGPSGTSFVPGLVHELRNFIFGISASLDAFEARFSGQEATAKYGTVMRSSLDRLNSFLAELKEYGDPQRLSWSRRDLEPLLREAIEHHRPRAAEAQIAIQLEIKGPLPSVMADDESLRSAFIRLLDLALDQEPAGGRLVLQAGTRVQAGQSVIFGYLDGAGVKLESVDLSRLFEPFYYRASGVGRLTLPVARRIFEAHGGNLSAGASPSGGLRMGFLIPGA